MENWKEAFASATTFHEVMEAFLLVDNVEDANEFINEYRKTNPHADDAIRSAFGYEPYLSHIERVGPFIGISLEAVDLNSGGYIPVTHKPEGEATEAETKETEPVQQPETEVPTDTKDQMAPTEETVAQETPAEPTEQ
jgi:hypothetical protein